MPLKQRVSVGASGGASWLQCTHVAEGHVGAALALAATPGLLYSGGVDRSVRGWDLSAGREAWRGWCGGGVCALAAPPGLLLAAAGASVRAFDSRLGAPIATLWSSGVSGATGVATSSRGETAVTALAAAAPHRLYTAAGDRLRLWDLRMMECVCKWWSGHAAAVMCLAAARVGAGGRGDRLASGSRDHCVRLLDLQPNDTGAWEIGNRRLLEPPHYDGVQALLLTGEHLYSASRDSSLKCWSLADDTLTHSVMNAHKGWVTGLCAAGGGRLCSAGRDQALRLWGAGLRPLAPPAPLPDAPHALAAPPSAPGVPPALFTAGSDGRIRFWRMRSYR